MNISEQNIGLERSTDQCFFCTPDLTETLSCVNHPSEKSVLHTYIKDFYFLEREGTTQFWGIRQSLHREVFCPKSANCDKVNS